VEKITEKKETSKLKTNIYKNKRGDEVPTSEVGR